MGRLLRNGWSLLVPLVVLFLATPGPALAAWMQAPVPYRAKDFTIIKKDGLYHLFYIRRNVTVPVAQSERDFGHAVSWDLYNWQQLPAVLTVRDSSWDNRHVWAPSVIERDGVYYLFYTGVSDVPGLYNSYQRMGVASSTDLMTWNRVDPPIYSCDQVPWAFCDSLEALNAFRDPFVMPDPSQPGHYLMYYTGNLEHDSTRTVVGLASSSGDLTQWSDVKPMMITHQTYSGNTLTESPHVFEHDGTWYLMFTTGSTQPISYATGPDPTGDPSSWTYRGRLGTMLGVNTGAWFASEYLRDGLVDYFLFVNSDRVQINKMIWHPDGTFQLVQPDLFHVVHMSWAQDTVPSGHPIQLKFVAVNSGSGLGAALEAALVDSNGVETPAPLDSLGLPASFTLPQDTTSFTWFARRWPSTGSSPSRVIVRMADHTASTGIVVVPPDTTTPPTFRVTGLKWTAPVAMHGTDDPIRIASIAGAGHVASIEAFTVDSTGIETAAPLDSLGLPASIALAADTTVFHWNAHLYPSAMPQKETRVRIRLAGDTLGTGILRVLPDTVVFVDSFHVVSLNWSANNLHVGDPATLTMVTHLSFGQVVTIVPFLLDAFGIEHEVPSDSVALPLDVELYSDTTRIAWTARLYPTGQPKMQLKVRVDSDTVAAQLMTVWPKGVIEPPPELVIERFDWCADSVRRGRVVPLQIAAINWPGAAARLAAFTVNLEGTETAAPLAPLGLPDSIALVADTTRYQWTATTWPDTTLLTRLRLRVVGDTLKTRVLSVLPDSVAGGYTGLTGGSNGTVDGTLEHVKLRNLPRGMFGSVGFVVELDAPTPARLEVFDIAGRRVRMIANRTLPKGASVLPWDARDGAGQAADAGVYFVRLTTPRITRMVRTVVLR